MTALDHQLHRENVERQCADQIATMPAQHRERVALSIACQHLSAGTHLHEAMDWIRHAERKRLTDGEEARNAADMASKAVALWQQEIEEEAEHVA